MSCIYKYENKDYTKEELIIELATNRIDVVNSKLGLNLENSSKVVDENGEPLVVYHGTDTRFSDFNTQQSRFGLVNKGLFYFTPNIVEAERYGEVVLPVFLNARRIGYILKDEDRFENKIHLWSDLDDNKIDGIFDNGYVIGYLDNGNIDRGFQIVINSPNQIKSAENTRFEVEQESKDIRYFKKSSNQKEVQTNIQTDSEYLLNDFVADFAAEKLKNPTEFNRQFKITETGIELASNDIITLEAVKAYIQDGAKYSKEIADYSLLSKDMPNLKEKDSFTVESVQDKRIKAVNDINSVSKPTTEITIIDEESFSAPNETNQFLRIGESVYEMQEKGYYNKLQKNTNPNFFNLNPQAPEFKNFDIQQEESSENKAKKLLDKETDNENFSCLS